MSEGGDGDRMQTVPKRGEGTLDRYTTFPYQSLNAAGEIVSVNDAWIDCLGYDRDTVEGAPFIRFLPDESRDTFERIFEEVKEVGEAEGSFDVRHAEDYLIRIQFRGRAERNSDGEFVRCHGQFLDSREFHERTIQLEKAQDVANIGRWSKEIPSDRINWSDRVYEIWGVERDGNTIDYRTFIDRVHPEDRDRVEAAWEAAKAGEQYDLEHRIVPDEGEVKWVREKAEVEFDDNGAPVSATGIVQDITERKDREQERKERQEKYETLVESSQDGIMVIQEGQFVMVNERLAEMLGYDDPKDLEGERYIEHVAPADRDLVKERYQQRLSGDEPPPQYEIEALTATGETMPVELNASKITYDGYPADMAIIRDISERKRREQDLRRFKNAVEAAGQAIVIADEDGTIEYVNPAFEEITGYTAEEAIGRTPRILKSGDLPPEFYEEMWETITGGETWQAEFTNRRKNGERYYVNQTVSPITDEAGNVEAFAAVQTDISDRVDREKRLKIQTERLDLALDGANLAVWDWDMETDEVYHHDRWAEMLGFDPDEIGAKFADWKGNIFPGDQKRFETALEAHIDGDAEYLDVEYRVRTDAGDWKWLRNRGKIVERAEDGTPTRAVGIHQDIDDRKRTKRALEQNNELLQAIDRVLRHNINNDMNVIKGFAETIKSSVSKPIKSQADHIISSSEKLLETTDKERRITKLLSEGEGPEPIEIGSVVEKVVARQRERYPGASVAVSASESVTVTAVTQIDQALMELLENATIHADTPDPTIRIELQATEDAAILRVIDDGPGIPEMERRVLTGEGEITPLYHGSGLGLWFVNLVVNRSEGELDFSEMPDGGSMVRLRLPRP